MIQKSELQQVPVEQRIPGRVYGVADTLDGGLLHVDIHKNKNEGYWANWKYWFALPESMLPVREVMPDKFELKQGEWEYDSEYHEKWMRISAIGNYESMKFRRIKKY